MIKLKFDYKIIIFFLISVLSAADGEGAQLDVQPRAHQNAHQDRNMQPHDDQHANQNVGFLHRRQEPKNNGSCCMCFWCPCIALCHLCFKSDDFV